MGASPRDSIGLAGALLAMSAALALSIPVGAVAAILELGWIGRVSLVQLACFAAPALLVTAAGAGARAGLGLRRPPAAALLGAALLGATFWLPSAALVAPWFERFQTEADASLAATLTGADPLLVRLAVLAVLPGLCEELLVRGAILRGLAPRLGAAGAVVASSAFFALLHLSPARALPSALLGAVLAVIALRSGSLWPAVLAHILNNAAVVILSDPGLDLPLDDLAGAVWLVPAAGALSLLGLALVWRAGRGQGPVQGRSPW